jgi:DNA-binding MarR family transcriptional regulator
MVSAQTRGQTPGARLGAWLAAPTRRGRESCSYNSHMAELEIARDCLGLRVRKLSRAITRVYDTALRPHGLTIAQLSVLSAIQNLEPVASKRLADGLSMEISTLSRNVALLEQEGWVTVSRAERGNGRVLRLTPAGTDKLDEAKPAWARAQHDATALLGDDGAALVTRLVDDVLA